MKLLFDQAADRASVMRITVYNVLSYLAAGMTNNQIRCI
jgi:hypothetical protein